VVVAADAVAEAEEVGAVADSRAAAQELEAVEAGNA
jgi:hypothetical protein